MEFFNNNDKGEGIPKYLMQTKNDLNINVDTSLIDEFSQKNNIHFCL